MLRTSDMLLKAFECSLTVSIRNVIMQRWTHSNGKVNGFSWSTWKHTFDGPDIGFFPSLKYSLCIFVTGTKSYDDGNGNPLLLTGPLQPWRTLTLSSQMLTKVVRTSLQVTSQIVFMKFLRWLIVTKKPLKYCELFCEEYFQKFVKFARRKNKKVFWDTK